MPKYYFKNDDEMCYTIAGHIDQMKFNEEKEREVFVAAIDHNSGMFFCKEYSEVGEVNGTCGKQCDSYTPRNGKTGICKHYGFVYEQTDVSKTIKLK